MTSPSSPGRTTTRSAPPSRRAAATHSVDWWATFSSSPPVPAAEPVVASHIPFPVEHMRHFGGLHHFDLLNHPSVYEAMREWLDVPSGKT